MAHAIKPALIPGQPLPFDVPGTLHRVEMTKGVDGINVAVWNGSDRPDGWTYTYADETVARTEARRAVKLIAHYGGTEQIRRRQAQLAECIREQDARAVRRMHDRIGLADARAELDSLINLADAAALLRFRAEFAAA